MFRYLIYLIVILIVKFVWNKPYYSSMMLCIFVSLSPIINMHITEYEYYFFLGLIAIILMKNVIRDNLVHLSEIVLIVCVIIFILLQVLFAFISLQQIMLSVYRYILIPLTAYFSVIYIKKFRLKTSNIFLPYIIINLMICYYRSFFDYSFFGVLDNFIGTKYESLYRFGGVLFRPSNLQSPIVFSIELAVFWSLYLYENGKSKRFYLITILCLFPFYLMKSRSSLVLIILFIGSYLIYKKKSIKIFSLSILAIGLILIFKDKISIFEILTFQEESYSLRFSSALETINSFKYENLAKTLIGSGAGIANMIIGPNGKYKVYVENFHISLLYDAGVILFTVWIFFNIHNTILIPIKQNKYSHIAMLIIGILLVNMFSSNLTGYTIQILFWQLIFVLKLEQKKDLLLSETKYVSLCENTVSNVK